MNLQIYKDLNPKEVKFNYHIMLRIYNFPNILGIELYM